MTNQEAKRLASAAPTHYEDEPLTELSEEQRDLDELCERWVRWKSTRRMIGPPPNPGSVLGSLSGTRTRPLSQGGPDVPMSAELAALHLAYASQPDALDKKVFDLYYVHRVAPIKAAAAALGISRKHFYSLLGDFRKRIYGASQAIMAEKSVPLVHAAPAPSAMND